MFAAALLVLGAVEVSPAAAAAPWWGLTSGARPTYINPNAGEPGVSEVLEVTVTGAAGEPFSFARMTGKEVQEEKFFYEGGPFAGEPRFAELLVGESPASIQTKLEAPNLYGSGNIEVSGGSGTTVGSEPYVIAFKGALGAQSVPFSTGVSSLLGFAGTFDFVQATVGSSPVPDGEVYATVQNLGDAAASGAASPVVITDQLPSGLEPIGITAEKQGLGPNFGINKSEELSCSPATLSCEMKGPGLAGELPPFDQIELRIAVNVEPGTPEGILADPNRLSVSGGGVASAQTSHPLTVSTAPVPFGVETYSLRNEEQGGALATRAAAHPFQQTTTVVLDQLADRRAGQLGEPEVTRPYAFLPALAKDTSFRWPPGLFGNPSRFPTCTNAQFTSKPAVGAEGINNCPAGTVVGVAAVTITTELTSTGTLVVPIFNLEPGFGQPARLGFAVVQTETFAYIEPTLRSGDGEDYGLTVTTPNITQVAGLNAVTATVWGDPGDPAHANSRGWGCIGTGRSATNYGPCNAPSEAKPPAFLSLPTNCTAPLASTMLGDSWTQPFPLTALPELATYETPALGSCNQVPFDPKMHAEPTSNAATSPTGLAFDLGFEDEGLLNPEGLIESQLKKAVVTLPQGFTTNPSVAEGLKACSPAQFHAETLESQAGEGCPDESKIGDVELESPLIEGAKVTGSLYVATQNNNPSTDAQHPNGNLLTLYLVVRDRERGVIVKQALKVTPNPITGQLTTEVDSVPQLPFSKFNLSFRQGQRSPLITPQACGTYTVAADLYPWARPTEPVHRESSFQITQGPEGLPCPGGGVPPFHPVLEAGTQNNAAGTYSPFVTKIARKDSEQEITRFSIKLPTGMLAKLKGVSECSDAGIAQAKSREVEGGGTVEQEHPSCPANSEIGHSMVGSGVGNVLAYAPGKLYLAGPYHGSPISIVSITAAKVGPFDLGTVVVRFALDVNHETAEVSVDGANSDPIPHIVDGIPIHLRDLRAYVDRPGFTLNPTSCAKKSTAATVLGSGLDFVSSADDVPVTVSSPFQAADCASLGFKPKLAVNLVGKKTHRGALPAFKAVLTYPKYGSYANIASAQVTLPESEYLEQGHLKDVCTRKVFETGATPGENCPAKSIYGHARATTPLLDAPLEGPVYLRTGYGTKLPELAAALNGPQISITLAGKIDSVHKKGNEGSRIRNTFSLVPDAPVEKFVLELKGGKKGLLVNSTDVCKGTHKALAAFTGQNGKLDEYEPVLTAQCGKGGKKGKKSGGKKKAGK